jgi:hypothetical protein
MKAFICLLFGACFAVTMQGQGTLHGYYPRALSAPDPVVNFEARLTPLPGMEDASPGGTATFTLDRGFFYGNGGFGSRAAVTFLNIENKNGDVVHQGSVVSFFPVAGTPWNAVNVTWPDREPLTDPQISELLAGEWSVNIGLEGYSGNVIEGRILLIPEPSSLALLFAGASMVLICFSKKRR